MEGIKKFACIISFVLFQSFICLPDLTGQSNIWFTEQNSPAIAVANNPASNISYQNFSRSNKKTKNSNRDEYLPFIELSPGNLALNYYNGFGVFHNTNLFKLLFNANKIAVPQLQYKKLGYQAFSEFDYESNSEFLELKSDLRPTDALYGQISIAGPSVLVYKGRFQYGLLTGMEFMTGSKGLSDDLSFEIYRMYQQGDGIQIPDWNIMAQTYGFIGIHGGIRQQIGKNTTLIEGINLKYLVGIASFAFEQSETVVGYDFIGDGQVSVSNLNAEYHYTVNNLDSLFQHRSKGNGVGVDLGFSLSHRVEKVNLKEIEFSASIKNLGIIKYDDRMRSGQMIINNPVLVDYGSFSSAVTFDQIVDSAEIIVKSNIGNKLERQVTQRSFTSPVFNLVSHFRLKEYAGIMAYYVAPISKRSMMPHLAGICPILTLNHLKVKTPFSYNNYSGFKLGLGIQASVVSIGTDDIRSLFNRNEFRESSFYFGIAAKLK